jgi:hypothetical protein
MKLALAIVVISSTMFSCAEAHVAANIGPLRVEVCDNPIVKKEGIDTIVIRCPNVSEPVFTLKGCGNPRAFRNSKGDYTIECRKVPAK